MTVARLTIADNVAIENGRAFADEWIRHFLNSDGRSEAFGHSKVIEWPEPDYPFVKNPEGVARYQAISDEIVSRVTEELREQIAEAFVRIAEDVLTKERERQRAES